MNGISSLALTFSCPHCNAHFVAGAAQTGAEVTCPACQKPVTLPAQTHAARGAENKLNHGLLVAAGLVILAVVSPVLMMVAMCLCGVTGPLVIVVAPVVGFLIARVACGYVHDNHGKRWFWYYSGIGLVAWVALFLWTVRAFSGRAENPVTPLFQGFAAIFIIVGAVVWSVAAAWTLFTNK